MELRNKEYKALEGDKLSCSEFSANQARIIFHALAYNTMFQWGENLPGKRQSWSFESIQKYLLRMAVQVTRKGRHVVMHWVSDFQWERAFWSCAARLRPKETTC
ncbi:MAG: hypothetical protein C0473_01110 [Cyanobacteria bacterium DS3.002]|jgi:hypothetical protein|nr:hypothetical protein [Cyanobacteria bacterium DS3.002]